jgi:hypothetical protein
MLTDVFVLNAPGHPNLVFVQRYYEGGAPKPIQWQPIYFFNKLQLIVAMKPAGELPSPFAIPMMVGTLFGLLALFWRPTVLQMFPVSVGLMLVAAFVPYYFVNFWAYPPRFSIHVLPIATASLIIVWDQWVKLIGRRENFPIAIKVSRLFGGLPPDDQIQK